MKVIRCLACFCVAVLSSCSTTGLYQSTAPETRGERGISSNIELVKEVALERDTLGVFYSREIHETGGEQVLLFRLRGSAGRQGTMDDYDLSRPPSLSVDQAKKFVAAIDNWLGTDPKSLAPSRMYNFELYSGTVDVTVGNEAYHPFKDLKLIVLCSVTDTKKSFKAIFQNMTSDITWPRSISYRTFDLTAQQVQSLRQAISEAINKGAQAPVAPADKPGT